jgi:hypothetical protein
MNRCFHLNCRPPGDRVEALVPGPRPQAIHPMILPPIAMDLGLLLISIGAVNLWKARKS